MNQAMADHAVQKGKLWTAIDFKGSLGEKIQYYVEPQLRFISNNQCFNEANLYVGLGYSTSPKITLWLGNMFNTTHKQNESNTQQYRIWEQVSWDIFGSHIIRIDSRTRLEQRKQEHQGSWSFRLREKIELDFPLKNDYLFILYDEIFLNVNHPSWVNNEFVNQNRAFAGFSIPLTKLIRFETGYLNQFVINKPDQLNHVLNCTLRVKNFSS